MSSYSARAIPVQQLASPALIQQAAGFLAGLTVTLPLCGRFLGLPGRFYGLGAAFLCLVLAVPLMRRPQRLQVAAFALVGVFAIMVLAATNIDHWLFLLAVEDWPDRDAMYSRAKLLAFLLSFGPPVAAGVAVSLLPDRRALFQGIAIGCIAAAVVFLMRVSPYLLQLVGADYEVARPFYMGEDRGPYSLISGALVMLLAGLSAFWLRAPKQHGLELLAVPVFLFAASWFLLRTETLLLGALLVASAAFYRRLFKVDVALAAMVSILLAVPLASVLRNEVTVSYWTNGLAAAAEARLSLLASAFPKSGSGSEMPEHFAVRYRHAKHPDLVMDALPVNKVAPPKTGLGSFAAIRPDKVYPHNLLVEVHYEIGKMALAALLGLLGMWAWIQARNLWRKEDPYGIALSLMGAGLLASAMKAGDITNAGNIVFFVLASMAVTPTSAGQRDAQLAAAP